jgi:hypothetical protein
VLHFKQSKTGAWLKTVVTPTLRASLDAIAAARKKKSLHSESGTGVDVPPRDR